MRKEKRKVKLDVLEDLVRSSGLNFNDKNTRSWVLDCPKCGKKDRLYIRKDDGQFVCFYCRDRTPEGFSGAPEYALTVLLGRPVEELQELLYGAKFIAKPILEVQFGWRTHGVKAASQDDLEGEEEVEVESKDSQEAPVGLVYPPDYCPIDHPKAGPGRDYMAGRGVPLDICLKYRMAYDTRRRRVVFPVYSRGVLVGWQARATRPTTWIDEEGVEHDAPKILTTILPRTRDFVLMFEERLEGSPHAVLVEGPVDAIKCDLCGGNVASMGKSVAEGQLERVKSYGIKRLYLGQDPDASVETQLLVKRYNETFELFYMTPEGTGYEDWGAMPPECALECFQRAERVHPRRMFVYFNPKATPRF